MQSLQDFVRATSSAGVKICFVIKDINNSNMWEANYETLGKAKENSLQKMHESLKDSASRTGKNKRNKKARSYFKGDTPTIIVADPSYRKIGLENLYNEVCFFASNFKGRDIHPTLVIDDFCASEQDIIDLNESKAPLGNHKLSLINPFVHSNQHLYEVINLVARLKLSLIPVVDEDHNYIGIITLKSIIENLSLQSSIKEPGGIIILEMGFHDYALSEIARIVESNGAKILSTFIDTDVEIYNKNVNVNIEK